MYMVHVQDDALTDNRIKQHVESTSEKLDNTNMWLFIQIPWIMNINRTRTGNI